MMLPILRTYKKYSLTFCDFLRFGVRIKFKGRDIALDFHILLEAHRAEVQEVGTKEGTQNHKCPRNLNMKPLHRVYKIYF